MTYKPPLAKNRKLKHLDLRGAPQAPMRRNVEPMGTDQLSYPGFVDCSTARRKASHQFNTPKSTVFRFGELNFSKIGTLAKLASSDCLPISSLGCLSPGYVMAGIKCQAHRWSTSDLEQSDRWRSSPVPDYNLFANLTIKPSAGSSNETRTYAIGYDLGIREH